jgi:hypothetical protein
MNLYCTEGIVNEIGMWSKKLEKNCANLGVG